MANSQYNNSQRGNDEFRFDLRENIGIIGSRENGWNREVNIVAWNGGAYKVDIRDWDPDHKRMSKGITLFEDEAEELARALAKRYKIGEEPAAPAFVPASPDQSPLQAAAQA